VVARRSGIVKLFQSEGMDNRAPLIIGSGVIIGLRASLRQYQKWPNRRQEMGYRVIMKYLKKNDTNLQKLLPRAASRFRTVTILKKSLLISKQTRRKTMLDVSKLEFMIRPAIGMLLIIQWRGDKARKTLSVIVGDSLVRRLIESTQLKLIFPILQIAASLCRDGVGVLRRRSRDYSRLRRR